MTELAAPNECVRKKGVAFQARCRTLPCSVVRKSSGARSASRRFGEAKETIIAARRVIPCAKCAGLQGLQYLRWPWACRKWQAAGCELLRCCAFVGCAPLLFLLRKKTKKKKKKKKKKTEKVFAMHLSHRREVGHKAQQVSNLASASCTSAGIKCCSDMAFNVFNPKWTNALQKVCSWRVGTCWHWLCSCVRGALLFGVQLQLFQFSIFLFLSGLDRAVACSRDCPLSLFLPRADLASVSQAVAEEIGTWRYGWSHCFTRRRYL